MYEDQQEKAKEGNFQRVENDTKISYYHPPTDTTQGSNPVPHPAAPPPYEVVGAQQPFPPGVGYQPIQQPLFPPGAGYQQPPYPPSAGYHQPAQPPFPPGAGYQPTQPPPPGVTFQPQPSSVQIVNNSAPPIGSTKFDSRPVRMICPECNSDVLTAVSYRIGNFVILIALLGFCFGWLFLPLCLFVCIPCFIDSWKDAEHSCPNCQKILGTFKRI